jgi:hypothetical protein
MRPFRQGDLDGLCGVYSVLNAIKGLGYRDNLEGWQTILSEMIVYLHETKESTFFFTDGINTPDMSRILKHIACINHNIAYSKPFHNRSVSLSELWETLYAHFDSEYKRSAILCIEGLDYGHWTVVSKLSEKRITLFDSDRIEWLNRSRCTTSELSKKHTVLIQPSTLFLLERIK